MMHQLTGVCPRVQPEGAGIVKTLAADGAQVALDVRVGLHVMAFQPTLEWEGLGAELAGEPVLGVRRAWGRVRGGRGGGQG